MELLLFAQGFRILACRVWDLRFSTFRLSFGSFSAVVLIHNFAEELLGAQGRLDFFRSMEGC